MSGVDVRGTAGGALKLSVGLDQRQQEAAASGAHLPGVEVQRGQLAKVDVGHVHVEGLRLVDEGAPVRRHVHQDLRIATMERFWVTFEWLRDAASGCAHAELCW